MTDLTRRFVLSLLPKFAVVAFLRKFFADAPEKINEVDVRPVVHLIRFMLPRYDEFGRLTCYLIAREAIVSDGVPLFDTMNIPNQMNGRPILFSKREKIRRDAIDAATNGSDFLIHQVYDRPVISPAVYWRFSRNHWRSFCENEKSYITIKPKPIESQLTALTYLDLADILISTSPDASPTRS